MKEVYRQWIIDKVPKNCHGMCGGTTAMMVADFPELRRVRGHAIIRGHRHPHWWCQAEDGEVIDPTESQFGLPVEIYKEYDGPELISKCLNCGDLIYEGSSQVCSSVCERTFISSLFN